MEFKVEITITDRIKPETGDKRVLTREGERELKKSFPLVGIAYKEVKELLCVNSPDDRDDYLQEGYLALTEAYKNYRDGDGKWQTYAMRCIKNAMIDYSRANYAQKRGRNTVPLSIDQISEDGNEFGNNLYQDDIDLGIVGSFEELLSSFIGPDRPKTFNIGIIALIRHAHGEPESEIAEDLCVNYKVLRRAVHDVKKTLRQNPTVQRYFEM